MPVRPTRMPTPKPKAMTNGSIASDRVQPALELGGPGPAALTTAAGLGARRAADRVVAVIVERVVGEVALGDPRPQVLVRPGDQGVVLRDAARRIALDGLRVAPRG